ncbi:MAG TPA: hypothetical protein VJB61_02610 [Actinomycetota bacterium]
MATSRRYQSVGYRTKKLLLGPALKTSQLAHERVSKRVALAVFSSDPISSTAYATEEILLVLVGGGLAGGVLATGLALPVALAIVALLALLVVSYRQVVDADPLAGGAPGGAAVRERLLDRHLPDRPAGPRRRPAFLFVQAATLLPRQLRKRGHRLVYSNGIIALSAVAIFLLVAFKADTHSLIPLYAVGVVISFTLAQAGMIRRHLRLREPGWRGGILINGVGAAVTMVALVVIVVGKFTQGAWMVVIAIPLLVWLLLRIQRTYSRELAQLKVQASQRLAPPKPRHEVVVLIEDLDQAALSALQYARQLNPLTITALHVAVDPDHARELGRLWAKVHIPFPLELVDAPDRNLLAAVEEAVAERVRSDTEVTVLVPRRRFVGFCAGSCTTRPRPA